MNRYVLRFDDVTPGMSWSRFAPLKARAESLGIRSVLGVVPDNRDPTLNVEPAAADFFDRVRAWARFGDTIAQHGLHHVYDTSDGGLLDINARSEFAGHALEVQRDRLAAGRSLLEARGVWQPVFMPPSHSFDVATLRALRDTGFTHVTDGFGFRPYRVEGITLLPCLTASPLWPIPGVCTICVHANTLTPTRARSLRAFLERRADRFVDFRSAARRSGGPALSARLERAATRRLLRLVRNRRST